MLPRALMREATRCACGVLCTLCVGACSLFQPSPPPPPPPPLPAPAAPPAPAPAPAPEPPAPPPDPATAADLATRRALAYYERLRQMSAGDVVSEVNRLGALVSAANPPASPDTVVAFALALIEEHNPGDLAHAATLLEPIARGTSPDPQPWQPIARLLAGQIAEERRLEDELERQETQRRDTQRTIQQLTEKLEALKAIERSMTAHSAGTPPGATPASPPGPEPAPPAPKMP